MTTDKKTIRRSFYRTTVTIEVLSDEPITDVDLPYLLEGIENGPFVGGPLNKRQKRVSAKAMAAALYEFGSEPGFFQLDDAGKPTDR
jgi:hypothetical protein